MLIFEYQMALRFNEPVTRHHFTLKCIPTSSVRQTITHLEVQLSEQAAFCKNEDSFGNECIVASVEEAHQEILIKVSGYAATNPCGYESLVDPAKVGIFRYPTAMTTAGESILALAAPFADDWNGQNKTGPTRDLATNLMHAVHAYMTYTPGATGTDTTAEEAAALRQGVCQDYSHIMLAVLRSMRIPCRYVVGLLMGEGKSHAWVEVCDEGKWVGYDPTNDCLIQDDHIAISHGRDCGDCEINRGVFYGFAQQTQEIEAKVTRI